METISPSDLKTQFIAWQCRIRQYSVRKNEGIPSSGMRPELFIHNQSAGNFNILIVKTESEDVTREFRYMIQKTHDPRDRYTSAIKLLSEYYYQIPLEFDEELTAVYSLSSDLADQIVDAGTCILKFEQGNQVYDLNCKTRLIKQEDPKYQTSYWHNHLFNSTMPGTVKIIGYTPDWDRSSFIQSN